MVKEVKVKAKDVLLQFTSPEPAALLASAKELVESIDLGFCGKLQELRNLALLIWVQSIFGANQRMKN